MAAILTPPLAGESTARDPWNRARGQYDAQTNPEFVALAKRAVEEVLADLASC
jgi:hypothetical protein